MPKNVEFFFDDDVVVTDDTIVRCMFCSKTSKLGLWTDRSVYCYECNDDHACLQCPECKKYSNYIWHPLEIVPDAELKVVNHD